MIRAVQIDKRLVGPGNPCFIIVEAGVNHNGDIQLAHQLIDAAVSTNADAIKFQSFVTEELVTPETPKAEYQVKTTGNSDGQYQMLKLLELGPERQYELKKHADEAGITYLSTPYDLKSVDILDGLSTAAFKIASSDVTNLPFLEYVAKKGRPVILSTGMSTLGEVEQAVLTLQTGGLINNIILLHCTSEYPAPLEEVNLHAILTLQQAFSCPTGFSDHTKGEGASPWARAVGACVIEKHFTLDRSLTGPDHSASLEPDEMKGLVRTIRDVEVALGDGRKRPMPSEIGNKTYMQKSLVARRAIRDGQVITADDLTSKRPALGLPPKWFRRVIGKRATKDIPMDGFLTLSSIDWGDT
jgi:N,N'-diacetyllegionaminate synthase